VTQDDEIQESYIQPQDKQQWLWNMISGHDHVTVECRISYIPILRNKKMVLHNVVHKLFEFKWLKTFPVSKVFYKNP